MRKQAIVFFLLVCLLLMAVGLALPVQVKAHLRSTKLIINRQQIALIAPMKREKFGPTGR